MNSEDIRKMADAINWQKVPHFEFDWKECQNTVTVDKAALRAIRKLTRKQKKRKERAFRKEVIAAMLGFSEGERAIVQSVIDGLERGRSVYGPLDLSTDERDFRVEATEELRDAVIYLTAALLQEKTQ